MLPNGTDGVQDATNLNPGVAVVRLSATQAPDGVSEADAQKWTTVILQSLPGPRIAKKMGPSQMAFITHSIYAAVFT